MANTFVLLLIAVCTATVNCHWPIRGRKWRPNGRTLVDCHIYGMKPVVNNGKITKCVSECEADHSFEYSYIHGYYCKQFPPGCVTSDCSLCMVGRYRLFDHGKNVCVEFCPEHHEERNGKCEEAPRGCKDVDCSECDVGYFYWPFPVYNGNRCRRNCPFGYTKNIEINQCEEGRLKEGCEDVVCFMCRKGYFKYVDKLYRNNCVKKCPAGYEEANKRCREIPAGCVNQDCSKCEEGYFLYIRGPFFRKCRESCPSGFFADQQKRLCVRCTDDNCVHCSASASLCEECRVPYALMPGKTEDTKSCMSKCPDGFTLSYTYDWLLFVCVPAQVTTKTVPTTKAATTTQPLTTAEATTEPTTSPTTKPTTSPTTKPTTSPTTKPTTMPTTKQKVYPPGCADEYCLKCKKGYFRLLSIGNGLRCLKKCPPGYYNISSDCILGKPIKPKPLPEGCKDAQCHLPCKDGFFKLSAVGYGLKCVRRCPIGYFTAFRFCIACHEPRCKHCSTSPFVCESCKDGFITFKGLINDTVKCIYGCPKGYKRVVGNNSVTCEKEPTPECVIQDCKKCADPELHNLHIGCIACRSGFLLRRNIFKDECISLCPDGYYPGQKPGTNISACLNCDIQFCQKCIKRKKCSRCFEPFVIDHGSGRCSLCKPGTQYNAATLSCKSISKSAVMPKEVPNVRKKKKGSGAKGTKGKFVVLKKTHKKKRVLN